VILEIFIYFAFFLYRMSVTLIRDETQLFEALLRRELPDLERKVHQLDVVIDHIDWERVCVAEKEETNAGYHARIRMADKPYELGFFSSAQSAEYLKVMQNLEAFVKKQGNEPLAIYGLEEFPTNGASFEDLILITNGVWRGIGKYMQRFNE